VGRFTIYLREDPAQRGMGHLGAGIVGSVASTGAAVGGGLIASAAGAGALAGPIGAGIGALVGVIAALWSAHAARAKGATTENQALNSALPTFFQSVQAIFSAANSGQITGAQAASTIQSVYQTFWSQMCPFTTGPGRADASNCGASCGGPTNMAAPCSGMPNGHFCNSSCTATCCVGCQDLLPIVAQAQAVFMSPTGGTVQLCTVSASKYGLTASGGGTVTYTPPAPTSAAGIANSLESSTSTIAGIPLWMVLAGGGLAAILAFR
jgi:hypothetical protein